MTYTNWLHKWTCNPIAEITIKSFNLLLALAPKCARRSCRLWQRQPPGFRNSLPAAVCSKSRLWTTHIGVWRYICMWGHPSVSFSESAEPQQKPVHPFCGQRTRSFPRSPWHAHFFPALPSRPKSCIHAKHGGKKEEAAWIDILSMERGLLHS